MAKNYNITMKQDNGTDYDNLYPKTISSQVLLSKQARNDLNLSEGATATDAVNSIQKDGGAFQVGDTLTTARTDLGNKWLLCNGSNEDATVYPDLSKLFPVVAKRGNDITVSPAVSGYYMSTKGANGEFVFTQATVGLSGSTPSIDAYTMQESDYSAIAATTNKYDGTVAWIPSLNRYVVSSGQADSGTNRHIYITDNISSGTLTSVGETLYPSSSINGAIHGYRYAGNYVFMFDEYTYDSTTHFTITAYDPSDWTFKFNMGSVGVYQNQYFNSRVCNVVYANGVYAASLMSSGRMNETMLITKLASDTSKAAYTATLTSLGCMASNTNKIFAFFNEKLQYTENGTTWTDVGGVSFAANTSFNNTAIVATDNYCFCWVLNNNVGTVYRLTSDFKTAVKCFDTPSGVTVNNIIIEEANNRVLYWMSNGTWLVSDLGSQFTLPTVSLSDNAYTYIKALK